VTAEFWKSAGLHLTHVNDDGWLVVTQDYLRAYYTRPEVHPVEESCANEIALHEALMDEPFMPVDAARLSDIADPDAVESYRIILAFRDVLTSAGTIEGAYLKLISSDTRTAGAKVPPVFLDQLVHLILRNILRDVRDPMRLRASELFFREQSVSTQSGRIMLADEEIVAMHGAAASAGSPSDLAQTGLGQLLSSTGMSVATSVPARQVELDVLDNDNADIYWSRSDQFDTVVDFRFERPALDAFARVIEAWLAHMCRLKVNVQPMARIEDTDWRWHIGLDRGASSLLNALYDGKTPPMSDMERIIGLLKMDFMEKRDVIDRVRGHPVYLGLAMSPQNRVKMKPQNLIMNLPLTKPV